MIARAAAVLAALLLAPLLPGKPVHASCQIIRLAELPVTLEGLRALVTLQVNGTDERFILDSGAFYSTLTPQAAAELKLRLGPGVPGLRVTGIGGEMDYRIARVKDLVFAGAAVHDIEFITGGTDVGAAGLLGQNLLRTLGDVEYDFAHGAVRIWRTKDCRHAGLAYWVAKEQAYSTLDIRPATLREPHTRGHAYVNGEKIDVLFDTGAPRSLLSLRAAARAGIQPGGPGVQPAGVSYGVGRRMQDTWTAPFARFKIGDEEIRDTRLLIGETPSGDDMLLGADFFLSHRVYVASSQDRLYFTYNGGPVFSLSPPPPRPAPSPAAIAPAALAPAATVPDPPGTDAPGEAQGGTAVPPAAGTASASPASPAPASVEEQAGGTEALDAAGYGRRAAIALVRHDYVPAIEDLTRAIALDPSQPGFLHDRARAYLGAGKPALARVDLDRFLRLRPADAEALLERARLRIAGGELSGALTDLGTASSAAPKEDGIHLRIGEIYQQIDKPAEAIAAYDRWLASHGDDARRGRGLLLRCRTRATWGEELDKAVKDCTAALRSLGKTARPPAQETLGLVWLRQGELDRSIASYDAALSQEPRNVWALYGRGLARVRLAPLHKGATADGQADLAAARAIRPSIEDAFRKMGLTP